MTFQWADKKKGTRHVGTDMKHMGPSLMKVICELSETCVRDNEASRSKARKNKGAALFSGKGQAHLCLQETSMRLRSADR